MGSPDSVFSATNTVISENEASIGGGVCIDGGDFYGYECLIINNTATSYNENQMVEQGGGGIYIYDYDCSAILTDSYIIGNEASSNGGGVRIGHYADTWFAANNVLIQWNTAKLGGGVFIEGVAHWHPVYKYRYYEGTFFAHETEIRWNTATDQGGGIYRKTEIAEGYIKTNEKLWRDWCHTDEGNQSENFSVNSTGKSYPFNWNDPVLVYDNTAGDTDTNQMRWK